MTVWECSHPKCRVKYQATTHDAERVAKQSSVWHRCPWARRELRRMTVQPKETAA